MPASTTCFHCGLPADQAGACTVQREGAALNFCCPGCRAVALTILDGGLGQFYALRDAAPTAVAQTPPTDYQRYDRTEFQADFVTAEGDHLAAMLTIGGISCAACAWLIERRLGQLSGVSEVHVNLARRRARIHWQPETCRLSEIFTAIERIGYQGAPYSPDAEEQMRDAEQRRALKRLGVAGLGMMQVGMYAIALHAGQMQGIADPHRDLLRLASLLMATAVVFYAARPFFDGAWRNIRNRSLGMDVPVSLAIALAYAASVWATLTGSGEVYFDSVAMFTFFLLGSRYLEMRARHDNLRASKLLDIQQIPTAWRLPAGRNSAEAIPASQLQLGDIIIVKPGEIVPADGMILSGHSTVDESAFSGETLPIEKTSGDLLAAGGINADGVLTMQVTATGEQTRLALIGRLLERAQAARPHSARMADQLAGYFVALVLLCALGALTLWLWWQPGRALWVALSVLVVSCPCALSLATPTALTAALWRLKTFGVLLSRSGVLERLPQCTAFVFDKTGTLTSGALSIERVHRHSDLARSRLLALAAALERDTNHPIATAFADHRGELQVERCELTPGQGVSGSVEGQRYHIGSAPFIAASTGQDVPARPATDAILVYLATDRALLATFELNDPIRPSALSALNALREQGYGIRLLSGDSSGAVPAVARQLGIDDYRGSQSPEQKLAAIRRWQSLGERIVMVGDGVNDAPVLAAADCSVAVTNATALAVASADCLLLSGDLNRLPATVEVARASRRIIRQNLGWALLYNLLAIPLAAAGVVPPWLAALGMSASSLVVVANATRLRRLPAGITVDKVENSAPWKA